MDVFATLSAVSEGSITEQRSKFIAFALPVQTPEEARAAVDGYRKRFHDARHVCWAYMLGAAQEQFRVNDDGEPSSTAGKPILGVIRSQGLTDVLIVVVRYFGGVKLGPSGLIAAYRAAAQEAVRKGVIVEKTVDEVVSVSFEYALLGAVMKVVKEARAEIVSQRIDNQCEMVVRIRQGEKGRLVQELEDLRITMRIEG
jgi:uncharacterized YigZ family protein